MQLYRERMIIRDREIRDFFANHFFECFADNHPWHPTLLGSHFNTMVDDDVLTHPFNMEEVKKAVQHGRS